jgi:hypothetical protein
LFRKNREVGYKVNDVFKARYGENVTSQDVWYASRRVSPVIHQEGKVTARVLDPTLLDELDIADSKIIGKTLNFIEEQYPNKALDITIGRQGISNAGGDGFRIGIPGDYSTDYWFLYDPKLKPRFASLQAQHGNKEVNVAYDIFHEFAHTTGVVDEMQADGFAYRMSRQYFGR